MSIARASATDGDAIDVDLEQRLTRLRAAYEAEPYPSLAVRKDRLERGIDMVLRNERRIVDAVQADFGLRAEPMSLLAEVMTPIRAMRHAQRHLKRWMRPEKRKADFPLGLIGTRNYVFHQPLGVVGIVSPWNAPFGLAFQPLAGVLAAGNRALIKPSEMTPQVAALMAELTAQAYAPDEVDVVQGGAEVGMRFSRLAFDHLVFTGSTRTGREVLKAAAEKLTPVTLELGGKAPLIVTRGSDIDYAAAKAVGVKLSNGGQICMGVDHVLVHASDRDRFVAAAQAAFLGYYPDFANTADVTAVFLPSHRRRLAALVQDAADRGATIIVATGAAIATLADSPRFPLVMIIDPPADAAVMRDEIFGPVMPILSYQRFEDAVQSIRSRPRPLAIYHIGGSRPEQAQLIRETHAGGMTFGDIMLHPMMHDLPFGGVGDSGMGRHVGRDGFATFSNAKAITHAPWIDITRYLQPPYSPTVTKVMRWALRF